MPIIIQVNRYQFLYDVIIVTIDAKNLITDLIP